jgi:hypothetical protein
VSGDRLVERGSGWINGASLSAAFCGVMTSAGSRLMISALAGPISQDVFADEPASVVVGPDHLLLALYTYVAFSSSTSNPGPRSTRPGMNW